MQQEDGSGAHGRQLPAAHNPELLQSDASLAAAIASCMAADVKCKVIPIGSLPSGQVRVDSETHLSLTNHLDSCTFTWQSCVGLLEPLLHFRTSKAKMAVVTITRLLPSDMVLCQQASSSSIAEQGLLPALPAILSLISAALKPHACSEAPAWDSAGSPSKLSDNLPRLPGQVEDEPR